MTTTKRRCGTGTAAASLISPRTFNKRSRQRFTANRIAALTRHLGREPSYAEQILICRIVQLEWQLRRQDAQIDEGRELSGHAMRARLAAENRLRLDLRELGLKGAQPPEPSLDAYLASKRAAQPNAEAV